jgi:hypothetical protein
MALAQRCEVEAVLVTELLRWRHSMLDLLQKLNTAIPGRPYPVKRGCHRRPGSNEATLARCDLSHPLTAFHLFEAA